MIGVVFGGGALCFSFNINAVHVLVTKRGLCLGHCDPQESCTLYHSVVEGAVLVCCDVIVSAIILGTVFDKVNPVDMKKIGN